jgi:hypothetical protein
MGLRPGDSMFLMDGLNLYEWGQGQQLLNGYSPAGDANTLLPIDAIQEFNIQQNPKAEFGWKPGVAINVGLKSGTNSLHGTAYAFGRAGSWDAKNFFNPQDQAAPSLSFEQYGATAGGPVMKDKLFWFVGFEAQTMNLGVVSSVLVPVDAAIGSTSKSIVDACNAVGRTNVTPLSATLAGLPAGSCTPVPVSGSVENIFPFNTGTEFAGGDQRQIVPSGVNALGDVNSTYNGLVKVDYHANDKNTLSGMFFIGDGSGTWDDNVANINSAFYESLFPVTARVGSGSWTYVPNSSIVNELKVGYTHYLLPFLSVDHNADPNGPWGLSNGIPTGYAMNSGITNPLFFGLPRISISGFTLTGGNWPKFVGPNQNTEFLDHMSYLHGKHAFKFGGEYTFVETVSGATSNAKGRINFKNTNGGNTALENFLIGKVGSGSSIFVGDPIRDVHTNQIAAFFQDDYRATARLTINLGVRYEVGSVWTDADNRLGNFDPNSATGLVQVGAGVTSPYNPDHRDWSPRVGFAWDVFGNQKTVIRAGAGLLYEFVPSSAFLNSGGNGVGLGKVPTGAAICTNGTCVAGTGTIAAATINPLTGGPGGLSDGWQNNGPGKPVFSGVVACGDGNPVTNAGNTGVQLNSSPAPCTTAAFARNLRVPYVETWNIDIQHSFTNNLSMDIAYLGNHGVKILGQRDINAPAVGTGWGDPAAGTGTGLGATGSPAYICLNNFVDPKGNIVPYVNCSPGAELGPFSSKFPHLQYIDYLSNQDRSHYNALQISLKQRTSHGLSFTAAYTYSHGLDDVSQNFGASIPLNNAFPDLNYGNSDYDIRHRFTFELSYALPGLKTPGQILQGWAINSVVTIQPGTPWAVQDTSNDFSGTNEVNNPNAWGEAWNFSGNPKDFTAVPNGITFVPGGNTPAAPTGNSLCDNKATTPLAVASLFNSGCYVSGNSVLLPPAYGQYGTVGKNIFRNPNFHTWDMNVTKDFKIKERLTAQFRAEFFNILNHPVFGQVDSGHLANNDPSAGALGLANNTPDAAAGNPVLGTGSSRDVQLGLKLIF